MEAFYCKAVVRCEMNVNIHFSQACFSVNGPSLGTQNFIPNTIRYIRALKMWVSSWRHQSALLTKTAVALPQILSFTECYCKIQAALISVIEKKKSAALRGTEHTI